MCNNHKYKNNLWYFAITLFLFVLIPTKLYAGLFQGKPLPDSKSYFVYEIGIKRKLGKTTDWLGNVDIGYFVNRSNTKSLGGSLYFGFDDNASYLGLRFKYRHWYDQLSSIDISSGITIQTSNNYSGGKNIGFISSAAIGFKDLIAFEIHLQIMKKDYMVFNYQYDFMSTSIQTKTKPELYMGIRTGSKISLGITAVGFLLGVLFLIDPPEFKMYG